jgi:hypothetical protein
LSVNAATEALVLNVGGVTADAITMASAAPGVTPPDQFCAVSQAVELLPVHVTVAIRTI